MPYYWLKWQTLKNTKICFTCSASCWWIIKQLYGSRDSLSSAQAIARFTATSEDRLRLSARGTTADEKDFTFLSNPLQLKECQTRLLINSTFTIDAFRLVTVWKCRSLIACHVCHACHTFRLGVVWPRMSLCALFVTTYVAIASATHRFNSSSFWKVRILKIIPAII